MTTVTNFWLERHYPTTIMNDRYSGTYSGGEWLAFPLDYWNVPAEVDGGDIDCMLFWDTYDGVVGKGNTPQEAMEDLIKKMDNDTENKES